VTRHSPITLRKNDAEPLTRADVQYDLLSHLFNENSEVFADHGPRYDPARPPSARMTFRALYIRALLHSTKLSGVVKDRCARGSGHASHSPGA
jgi:Ino eighty subunit 1